MCINIQVWMGFFKQTWQSLCTKFQSGLNGLLTGEKRHCCGITYYKQWTIKMASRLRWIAINSNINFILFSSQIDKIGKSIHLSIMYGLLDLSILSIWLWNLGCRLRYINIYIYTVHVQWNAIRAHSVHFLFLNIHCLLLVHLCMSMLIYKTAQDTWKHCYLDAINCAAQFRLT